MSDSPFTTRFYQCMKIHRNILAALALSTALSPSVSADDARVRPDSDHRATGHQNTALLSPRSVYGYVRTAPMFPLAMTMRVHLQGPGVDRWTKGYWHPFSPFGWRYYFNGVPTGRDYTITAHPEWLYQPRSVSFHLPRGFFDYKAPDIILRIR